MANRTETTQLASGNDDEFRQVLIMLAGVLDMLGRLVGVVDVIADELDRQEAAIA